MNELLIVFGLGFIAGTIVALRFKGKKKKFEGIEDAISYLNKRGYNVNLLQRFKKEGYEQRKLR